MKVTKIKMSEVADKKKPFENAVWHKATADEKAMFYNAIANIEKSRITA